MSQKCTECKNLTPFSLKCQNSEEKVKVYQFELTKAPFQKRDKKQVNWKTKSQRKLRKLKNKWHTQNSLLNFVDIKNHTLFTNMKFLMIYTTRQRFSKLPNYNWYWSCIPYGLFWKHQSDVKIWATIITFQQISVIIPLYCKAWSF